MMSASQTAAMSILANDSSPLAKTMAAISEIESAPGIPRETTLAISSNATVNLLGVFLRKHALLNGVRLNVRLGNHDDPVGDIESFAASSVEHVLFVPVFDNLLPSFEAQVGNLSHGVVAEKESELRARYRLVFEKAKSFRSVVVCDFHRLTPSDGSTQDRIDDVVQAFNLALRAEAAPFPNIRIIETSALVSEIGHASAFDLRYYFRSKAPYTTDFLDLLARRVTALSRGFGSYFYKALALDCDNTLWGGIIGEDLMQGIELDPFDYPGNVYWRVQNELVALERSGVLLCLCTKNNPDDVDEVFERHPAAILKEHHFVLKRVNWSDKITNLQQIAADLNIGLDSIVFLDDSEFECAAVRSQLPMVRTFQVPSVLSDFPRVIAQIRELFLAGGISAESRSKTEQYRQRAQSAEIATNFTSNEEFLASLGLRVELTRNAMGSAPRISELTMKSNQFNLTTRRYSVSEVLELMEGPNSTVYSMVVSDKFGSAGLTGVLVVRWEGRKAVVDSLLMSCRVIGRGVEFAIWEAVREDALERECDTLVAEYRPTQKNTQAANFFERLSLQCVSTDGGTRRYETSIAAFTPPVNEWIEVVCDK